MKRVLLLLTSVLAWVLLSQCASVSKSPKGPLTRAQQLSHFGYEPLALQKISGDVRYSGMFAVNGAPMRFLIDSGANSTDVNGKSAALVGLKPEENFSVISRGALGGTVKSGLGQGSLAIGPMFADRFPFTIASNTRKTSTSGYAGQIGLDALISAGALIDLASARLWVPGPDSPLTRKSELVDLGRQSGLGKRVIELRRASQLPHLILESSLNGKRLSWIVDTGAEVSVLSQRSLDRLGVGTEVTSAHMLDASGDRIPLRKAQLKGLQFEGVYLGVFDVSAAPLKAFQKHFRDREGRPVDGILGMDFLVQSAALIDSGSRLIYLGLP